MKLWESSTQFIATDLNRDVNSSGSSEILLLWVVVYRTWLICSTQKGSEMPELATYLIVNVSELLKVFRLLLFDYSRHENHSFFIALLNLTSNLFSKCFFVLPRREVMWKMYIIETSERSSSCWGSFGGSWSESLGEKFIDAWRELSLRRIWPPSAEQITTFVYFGCIWRDFTWLKLFFETSCSSNLLWGTKTDKGADIVESSKPFSRQQHL